MLCIRKNEIRCLTVFICLLTAESLSAQVMPTKEWVSFYSSNTLLNGEPVPIGAVITAYDADGLLCGCDTVSRNGYYGLLQVYRDDPLTPDHDEGADPGEEVSFKIDGFYAISRTGTTPLWSANGDRSELDLEAKTNWPPFVSDIPGQTVKEGENFQQIPLDDFVSDPDDEVQQLIWTFNGNQELIAELNARIFFVSCPHEDWFGSELITLWVSDPEGASDSVTVMFTVNAVNDTPVVSDISDQTIDRGETFSPIRLCDYVDDVDNEDNQIIWSTGNTSHLTINITDAVAEIIVNDPQWTGSETVQFTASDPDGLSDSDEATFVVLEMNGSPVISQLPGLRFDEDDSLKIHRSYWYGYIEDPDLPDSLLSVMIKSGSRIYVRALADTFTFWARADWFGRDTLPFIISDGQAADSSHLHLHVYPVNDSPVICLPDTIYIYEDTTYQIDLWSYVEDAESHDSLLDYRFFADGKEITWQYRKQSGLLTFLIAPEFSGVSLFTVTVNDDSNASATDSTLFVVQRPAANQINFLTARVENRFGLARNYPNPFNPQTTISYSLEQPGQVNLEIFNLRGQRVACLVDGWQKAGTHNLIFSAGYLSSGVYMYVLRTEAYTAAKKMLLLR